MNTLVRVVALIVLTVSVCDAYRIMLWDFDGATDTFEGESYPALWVTYDDHTWVAGSDRARAEVPGPDPLRPPVFWDAASVDFKMGSETSDLHVSDQISELRDALDEWDAVTDDLSVNYDGSDGRGLNVDDEKNSIVFGTWTDWGRPLDGRCFAW